MSIVSKPAKCTQETALALPLFLSRIEAGFPSPADDYIEDRVDLNEHLIDNPSATFLVRVKGDSMKDAGIHSGDTLIVDRSQEPQSGDVVVAVVNGNLAVKRLRVEEDGVRLLSENEKYDPVDVGENEQFRIWGVVTSVVHSV
jgi:DNA polymerase V